ncbi:MAG: DUF819 family protein [Candidatus Izemoplasmatales bacterium]
MIYSIIQTISVFLIPLLIIKYHRFVLTKLFGTIGMAYLLGILVSFIVYLLNHLGLNIVPNADIGQIGGYLAISIAIPLLLFSSNLKEVKKLSKTVLVSFLSVIVSVVIVTSITFYVYARTINHGGELSAMAVGLYTGGTPNLNALAAIFHLSVEEIGIANFSDMIIGAVFYVFLLVLSQPLLKRILKKSSKRIYLTEASNVENTEAIQFNEFKHSSRLYKTVLIAFAIVVISALSGFVLWMILGSKDGTLLDILVPTLMIGVTVLGIAASFNTKIRETKGTNVIGQYMILVFSFAIASSIDLNQLSSSFGQVLLLYSIITIGTFALHTLFAYFLKIDADCTIVTATAGIYGPAFVPAVTNQLKNDSLTVPGLICGSVGYALGTFLGILLGLLFIL